MDRFDRFMIALFVLLGGGTLILVGACVVQLIQGPWEGTGKVLDKTHHGSYISFISCGKGSLCPYNVPECYQLTVREYNGDEHTGCVRAKVWEDTTVGQTITLTKETAS